MHFKMVHSNKKKAKLEFVNLKYVTYTQPIPGGYLVQKTLRGCAANMGSKIGLLVYE